MGASATKILFVVAGLPGGGGFSETVPAMASALARRGCETTIATVGRRGELARTSLDAEGRGVRLVAYKPSWPRRIYFSWQMLRSLETLVREADAVYIQGDWTFPVWHAGHLALRLGKRLVMGPAGSFNPVQMRRSELAKRLASTIDFALLRRAHAVHATSDTERNWILAVPGMANRADRVFVAPLGVELPEGAASAAEMADPPETLLYLGRIHPMKGLNLLLEALSMHVASHPGSKLRITICGPDEAGFLAVLKKFAARLGVTDRVTFLPPVSGTGKWKLIAEAGGIVLPSLGENFGLAVAEGLAIGRPVICTRACPWPKLEDDGLGWLADCSATSIAAALNAFHASSPFARAAMGCRARAFAVKNLSWDRTATALLSMMAGRIW